MDNNKYWDIESFARVGIDRLQKIMTYVPPLQEHSMSSVLHMFRLNNFQHKLILHDARKVVWAAKWSYEMDTGRIITSDLLAFIRALEYDRENIYDYNNAIFYLGMGVIKHVIKDYQKIVSACRQTGI